jgi:predicted DNA-binding transcriptional regulator AlpA
MLGKQFITDKEASERYGYSQSWFLKARANSTGPKYVQIKDAGRVLYPLAETDAWFKTRMEMKE